jgi:hypothetical protein
VTAVDITGDGLADIITTSGPGGVPNLRAFDAASTGAVPDQIQNVLVDEADFTEGIFVAASVKRVSLVLIEGSPSASLDQLFADGHLLDELLA